MKSLGGGKERQNRANAKSQRTTTTGGRDGRARGDDGKNRSFPGEKKTERQVANGVGWDRNEEERQGLRTHEKEVWLSFLSRSQRGGLGVERGDVVSRVRKKEREREREREESVLSGEGTLEEKVAKGGNKRRSRMSGN